MRVINHTTKSKHNDCMVYLLLAEVHEGTDITSLLWNSQKDIFIGTLTPPCIFASEKIKLDMSYSESFIGTNQAIYPQIFIR